jgi:aminoglycoside phosphotransferase (APT) family kinase protein
MEYTEGEVEHSPADPEAFAKQVAIQLAHIHRVDAAHPELASLPAQEAWMAGVRQERESEVDESLGAREIRALLRAGWPLPHPNAPALLHGDPWPGNMVWRDGRLAALIDWEEAHTGDPLEDIAIARFDILSMLGRAAMETFTLAYASAQPHLDMTDLPYWDLYAALRPVNNISDWAGGWAELGRPDITSPVLRAAHREFADQAMERLRA